MKITEQELNPKNIKLNDEQKKNFAILLEKINAIRDKYGKPMLVTSGVRSWEDQVRIDNAAGRKPRTGSMHLMACAVDIWDRDRHLWGWVMDNLKFLEKLGVYMEDGTYTRTWVHFQIKPPVSGNRIFKP